MYPFLVEEACHGESKYFCATVNMFQGSERCVGLGLGLIIVSMQKKNYIHLRDDLFVQRSVRRHI